MADDERKAPSRQRAFAAARGRDPDSRRRAAARRGSQLGASSTRPPAASNELDTRSWPMNRAPRRSAASDSPPSAIHSSPSSTSRQSASLAAARHCARRRSRRSSRSAPRGRRGGGRSRPWRRSSRCRHDHPVDPRSHARQAALDARASSRAIITRASRLMPRSEHAENAPVQRKARTGSRFSTVSGGIRYEPKRRFAHPTGFGLKFAGQGSITRPTHLDVGRGPVSRPR